MDKRALCEALDRIGIDYRSEGANVSPGWVGIDCPQCDDSSKHMGIEAKSLRCSCWRCNCKGNLFTILSEFYQISWGEYKSLFIEEKPILQEPENLTDQIKQILGQNPSDLAQERRSEAPEYQWPPLSIPVEKAYMQDEMLQEFLRLRGFLMEDAQQYGCRVTRFGRLAHRLLIPIHHQGRMIGLLGRSMRDDLEPKYLAEGPLNQTLYGLERIEPGQTIYLVEGVFDQWRMEEGSLASFGKKLSQDQKRLLFRLRPKAIYFCWDPDAFWQVEDACRELCSFGIRIYKIDMLGEEKDPDLLGRQKILELCERSKPYLE